MTTYNFFFCSDQEGMPSFNMVTSPKDESIDANETKREKPPSPAPPPSTAPPVPAPRTAATRPVAAPRPVPAPVPPVAPVAPVTNNTDNNTVPTNTTPRPVAVPPVAAPTAAGNNTNNSVKTRLELIKQSKNNITNAFNSRTSKLPVKNKIKLLELKHKLDKNTLTPQQIKEIKTEAINLIKGDESLSVLARINTAAGGGKKRSKRRRRKQIKKKRPDTKKNKRRTTKKNKRRTKHY